MADEEVITEETTVEEETPEEETVETEEEKPSEETTEDESADDEFVDSEEEYLAQFHEDGLPDDIKTVEDVINSRIELGKQLEQASAAQKQLAQIEEYLQRSGFRGGIDAFLNQRVAPFSPQTQTATPSPQYGDQLPTFSGELEEAVRRGEVDEDYADSLRGYAKAQDRLLGRIYNALSILAGQQENFSTEVSKVGRVERDFQWTNFRDKSKFDRGELDKYRDAHNYRSYDEAARAMIALDPQRFEAMVRDVEKKAESRARKKLRINYQRSKKGGGTVPGRPNWKEYQSPDGGINEEKLKSDITKGIVKESDWDYVCDNIIAQIPR